jgi:hypothetical protein
MGAFYIMNFSLNLDGKKCSTAQKASAHKGAPSILTWDVAEFEEEVELPNLDHMGVGDSSLILRSSLLQATFA